MPYKSREAQKINRHKYYIEHSDIEKERIKLRRTKFKENHMCYRCGVNLLDDEGICCYSCLAFRGVPLSMLKGVLKYANTE